MICDGGGLKVQRVWVECMYNSAKLGTYSPPPAHTTTATRKIFIIWIIPPKSFPRLIPRETFVWNKPGKTLEDGLGMSLGKHFRMV